MAPDNQYPFKQFYPNIAQWVDTHGWIEVGYNGSGYIHSFIRALDEGGMVWEGRDEYLSVGDALDDLEAGLTKWMLE